MLNLTTEQQINIARDINVTKEELMELANSDDWMVRMLVARNIKTPIETLLILKEDENYYVRQEANTTIKVLN